MDNRIAIDVIGAQHVTEHAPHHFSADASDLGFRIGIWPESLKTTLGNKGDLIRDAEPDMQLGDLVSFIYRQSNGCLTLKVYND